MEKTVPAKKDRPKQTDLLESVVNCQQEGCDFRANGVPNALALGAQHYDNTKHMVLVITKTSVLYGVEPDK
jgi:hypothetical protein